MMRCDEEYICANGSWYLVHCLPRRETYAATSLRHQLKLQVFFPEERVRLRNEVHFNPLFPGYLFVLANLEQTALSAINTCPGVLRLVSFGGQPQSVPYAVIETITQQLERVNRGESLAHHPFTPGDAVHVKSGPLRDLNMIFVGPASPEKRVHVLLEFMGRLKDVQIDAKMLEKVPEHPPHPPVPLGWSKARVRYTRGKGRKLYPTR